MKLPLACHNRFISSSSGELVGQSLGSLCLHYIVMDRRPLAGDAGLREAYHKQRKQDQDREQDREQEREKARWNTELSVGTSEDGENSPSPSGMLSKSLVSRESASVFHSASDFLDDAPAEALRNATSRLLASIGTELGENELRLPEGNRVLLSSPQHRQRADTVPGFAIAREHQLGDVDPASDGDSSHSAVCLSDCHSAGPPSPSTISNVLDRYFHPSEEGIRSRVKLMCTFGGRIMSRPVDGKLRNIGGETRIHTVDRGIGYDKFMTKMAQLYSAPLTLKYQLPDEGLDALVSISSDDDFQNMMEEYDKLESSGGVSRLRLFFFTSPVDYEASAQFGSKNETEERCSSTEQRYVAALNGVQDKISVNNLEDDAMGFRQEDGPDLSGSRMLRDDLSTGLAWSVSPVKTFSRAPSTPSSPPLSPSLAIRQAHLKPLRMGDSSFQISKERFNSVNLNRRGLEPNCYLDIDQNGSSDSSASASYVDYQYRRPSGSPRRTQHEISASRGEGWRTVQNGMHRVNSQTRLNRPSEQQMDCGTVAGLKDVQTGMRRVHSQSRLMRPSEQQMDCGTVAGFKDGMHRVNSQTTLMRPSEQQMDCGTVPGLKDVQTGMHRVNSQTRLSRTSEQQMDYGMIPGLNDVQTGMHRVNSQTRLSRPSEQQMDYGTVAGLKDVQQPSEMLLPLVEHQRFHYQQHQWIPQQQQQQQQQQLAWQLPMEGNLGRGEPMQRYPLDVHRQPHAFHQTREAVQQLHQATQLYVHQTAGGYDFGCTQDSDIQGVPLFLQGSVQSHPQIPLGLAPAPSFQRGSAPSSPRIIHDCKGWCNCAQHYSQVHRGVNVCLNDQSYSRRQPHLGDQPNRKHGLPQHVSDQPTRKHEFPDSTGLRDDASHGVERMMWQQHTSHFTVPDAEVGSSWRHVHERDAAQFYVADGNATSHAPQYCDSHAFTETSLSSSDHQHETNSTRSPRSGCYDDRWEAVVHPVYMQDQVGRWVTQRRSLELDDGTTPAPGLGHIPLHKDGGWRGELEVAERSEAEWELYYNHAQGDFESKRPLEIPVARAPHPGNFPMHMLPISRPLASEEMLISQASTTSSHKEVKQHPKLVALNPSAVVPFTEPKGWSDTPPLVIGHVPHTLLAEEAKISLSQAMPTTHCTSNSFLVRQGASDLENNSACKGLFSGKHGQVLGFCASESFVRDDTGRLIAASRVAGEAPSELLSALSLTAGFAEGTVRTSTTDGHAHLLSHSVIPVGSLAPLEVASALTQQTFPPVASSMTTLEGLTSPTSPVYDPSPLSSTDTADFSFEPSETCPIEGGAILDKEALMSSISATGVPADGMLSSIQKLRSNGEHCDESRVVVHEVANMNLHEVTENKTEHDKGTVTGELNTISPSSTDKGKGRAEAVNDWLREEVEKEQLPETGPVLQNDETKEDAYEEEDVAAGNVCVNEVKGSALTQAEAEARAHSLQIIKNADLEELRELGSGAFGTVFHGKWSGSDVAIKRIKASCFMGRPSDQERLISDFLKEACTLSQLHHPNVVAFYGVVPDGPEGTFATVTEYMVNGSLKQVLRKKDRTIDRRKRLLIGMGAAFGMEYLHSKNIVHFDLKCENLLVNMKDGQRPICKVGDFGLSKVKHQTMVSGGVRGTLPWMAPELLSSNSNMVTEKVDVFSFGIVMWEILTGEEPYANMHYGSIIGGIVKNTLRPSIPSWCEPGWRTLMERCWSGDPADRPAFSEVARELRELAASMNVR